MTSIINDNQTPTPETTPPRKQETICQDCQGSGLSYVYPEVCPDGPCVRCQHNEGYLVHPYQSCESCGGMGSRENLYRVLCIDNPTK